MAGSKKKDKPKNEKLSAAMMGNQNAIGNKGGHPPHYSTAEDLQAQVDDYFVWVKGIIKEERETVNAKTGAVQLLIIWEREPEPLTVTGLALHLGFASRSSLDDYEKKAEFSYIIKKARSKVENGYEKALHAQSPTGAIFALKNMGWSDRQELDHLNNGESFKPTVIKFSKGARGGTGAND